MAWKYACRLPLKCVSLAEPYIRLRAIHHLNMAGLLYSAAGTGNPFCSTDTAAILRAIETDSDIALLAKNIDGVYDKDPRQFADAVKYDTVSFDSILEGHLGVIDSTAATMAYDNDLPVLLFGMMILKIFIGQ